MRDRCPRQFLLRYVLNAQPAQPDDVARMRGRVIHAGLAAAFAARAEDRIDGDRGNPQMARYYSVARMAMMDSSDYALLSTLETMRAHAEVYQVLASIPPPHPAMVLGVELPFEVLAEGEWITGIIDYAVRTGETSLHVRDWKSGPVTWSPSADPAVPLYGLAAALRWPWATTITIGLYPTRTRVERLETLDPGLAREASARLAADARQERAALAELTADTADALYPPTPGEHCRTCTLRSYCPRFSDAVDLPIRPGVDVVTEQKRLTRALEQRS